MSLNHNQQPSQNSFKIYTMDYLKYPNSTSSVAIEMTSQYNFSYEHKVSVASEALELGSFASDSKQAGPFTLNITATKAPNYSSDVTTLQSARDIVATTISLLEQYLASTTLLLINSSFATYKNLALVSFSYDLSASKTVLYASLGFQEVRLRNSTYQLLPKSKVRNSQNQSTIDNGNQVGIPVTNSNALNIGKS